MHQTILATLALFACGFSTSCGTGTNSFDPDIIAMERTALDRWGRGDPQGYLEIYAPEVTYFDPFVEKRTDGLEAMRRYLAPITGKVKVDRYDMINPRVERRGDVAVLSYNLISYGKSPMERRSLWPAGIPPKSTAESRGGGRSSTTIGP